MSAFQRTYKKIHDTKNITGTEIAVDNIFDMGREEYLIVGNGFTAGTGTHFIFRLRECGTTNTDSDQDRGQIVIQHGQGNAIFQGATNNSSMATLTYFGTDDNHTGNFKIWYYQGTKAGYPSLHHQSIGHVNGTGYRLQSGGGFKEEQTYFDGFVVNFNGQTMSDGRLRVFKTDVNAGRYI
jgi:hypothetical protein